MEEKIQTLFEKLRAITAAYLIYRDRGNIEKTKEVIPQIQEFVLWFMEENRYGVGPELYQGMCQNLVEILEDILSALEQGDMVLLNDATAYGLMEYLELFADTGQEGPADDTL